MWSISVTSYLAPCDRKTEDDRQDTPAQRTMAVGKGPPSQIGC